MDSHLLLEIYKSQAKMIYFYLKKNGCRHEDAEDIVQESYAKFIAYSSGVPSEKALSYIFTIAMNEFKKLLKKKGKERAISIDDFRFWNNFANDDDTEVNILNSEMKHEIAKILESIQEVYKQLLLLKYELELSYKEIALLLGMKEETVRTYLFRARKEFQKNGGNCMNDFPEELFDEKRIKKAVRKGKVKTILTVTIVSIVVFVVLSMANFAVSAYYSEKAFKQWDAYVRLSTPNGYISETVDSAGILGGISNYEISKNFKIKSIAIEQKQYSFGLIPSVLLSRYAGGGAAHTGEDWQFNYKENGWRELMFFHPNVSYKEYKNDEELINSMQGNKIYEVALSFDQPYKSSELFMQLPEMTWFWLDTYNNEQLNEFQQMAKENDWSSTFVRESEALGFSINRAYNSIHDLEVGYEEFLELLQLSISPDHQNAFNKMQNIKIEDVEILGVVVYGTKEELKEILENPIIKASSIGGVIENY